jgi:hypothetical protein
MSNTENVRNDSNLSKQNYNTAKLFLFNNDFRRNESVSNAGGSEIVYKKGTIMGRVESTLKIIPLESDATDGSNVPVGVLATDYTIPAATLGMPVTICIGGEVEGDLLIFAKAGDTLDTVIDGRTLRDRLNGDTLGIKVIESVETSDYDNA